MKWFKLNPLTRRRLHRFRKIKRGYYSFVILLVLTAVSMVSELVANSRAIIVRYEGATYLPVWDYVQIPRLAIRGHTLIPEIKKRFVHPMVTFGQEDEWGFNDSEADYRLLNKETESSETSNWVLMPPIPWNPYEQDFLYADPPPNPPDIIVFSLQEKQDTWHGFRLGKLFIGYNIEGRHLIGTDSQGRDVFARLLYGFRISILFALFLVAFGQVVGTFIGCLQGYLGGWTDILSQRVIEIWATIPFLYIVIIMAAVFRPGFWLLIVIMAFFEWIGITYFMRTEMYREKSREYCMAAKSYGASHLRVIFKHLLPNALTPLVTFTPFLIVGAISALTGLDYLGYGLPAPTPSWGELIDQALQTQNRSDIWLTLAPFGAIATTLILVTLIGESVREAFDPKQYSKYK
ncbi:ABC transporter permease subunit [Candidatus Poribacteria bacterium]|nr:ABC transporter permease subunit [Candidatus Poribacteria bacterium]